MKSCDVKIGPYICYAKTVGGPGPQSKCKLTCSCDYTWEINNPNWTFDEVRVSFQTHLTNVHGYTP